jgi:WD40 repeat protein
MVIIVCVAVALFGVSVYRMIASPEKNVPYSGSLAASTPSTGIPTPEDKPIGDPLYTAGPKPSRAAESEKAIADPVTINDCRLTVFEKEEVPSQRNGVIWIIGTEVGANEEVPADRLIVRGGKRYRRLMEGDMVKIGQLLAQLDDRLARDEWASKKAKILSAEADYAASDAAQKESRTRYETGLKLDQKGAIPKEELRERKLVWDKYTFESKSKKEAIELARLEANQAQTVVGMHEIHSSIDGVIKTIYKNPGEAVKSEPSYEPVFQILNLTRLRVEGVVDEQHLPQLRVGDEVVVEVPASQAPDQVLVGHLQEVTAVAVAPDKKTVVSASQDATARVWQRGIRRERKILHHPGAVLAVACSPDAPSGLCLTGAADGVARLWDLNGENAAPEPTKTVQAHRGSILCVAFSPDGKHFATGGDDREIAVYETESGKEKYRLRGHSGAVTAVTFTPRVQLVSAARDNTIRVWDVGTDDGRLAATLPRRSGDVSQPGVSPDGTQVLFDPWQSKTLRILGLPNGLTEGVLEEASSAARLTTFALFAPDAKTILTVGGAEGQLQLWQPPGSGPRPHVQRYLVTPHRGAPSGAAFAPDGSFLVVGTRDRQVLVYPREYAGDLSKPLKGRITHIERALDSHQARVWAIIDNPEARLMPGATVNMVKYPK